MENENVSLVQFVIVLNMTAYSFSALVTSFEITSGVSSFITAESEFQTSGNTEDFIIVCIEIVHINLCSTYSTDSALCSPSLSRDLWKELIIAH